MMFKCLPAHLCLPLSLSLSLLGLFGCGEEESGQPQIFIHGTSEAAGETLPWASPAKADELDPYLSEEAAPLPLLGGGEHSLEGVKATLIASDRNGLNMPRDLDFNPERPGELWVVNQSDDSVVLLEALGTEAQRSTKIVDPAADHFMEEVSGISFGSPGRFATCQESGNTYNNRAAPNLFMGPTLWSASLDVFGRTNPSAFYAQGFDLGSHLDMLHESPYCMGIEWAAEEAYWVFEGHTNSVALVDFRKDHGPGYDDHSDGVTLRFAKGELQRVPGIPSHMAYDQENAELFIADTGNGRIAVLDLTVGGEELLPQPVKEPGTMLLEVRDSAPLTTLPGSELLEAPSGLVLAGDLLYVADAATGRIAAFSRKGGLVDWLDTGAPGIMGLTMGPDGALYVVHGPANLLVRLAAR